MANMAAIQFVEASMVMVRQRKEIEVEVGRRKKGKEARKREIRDAKEPGTLGVARSSSNSLSDLKQVLKEKS